MTNEDGQLLDRRPMPVGIKYAIAASAFTVTWSYLNGDAETATGLSYALGWALLGLSAIEILYPVAEIAGTRIGDWWRARKRGAEP